MCYDWRSLCYDWRSTISEFTVMSVFCQSMRSSQYYWNSTQEQLSSVYSATRCDLAFKMMSNVEMCAFIRYHSEQEIYRMSTNSISLQNRFDGVLQFSMGILQEVNGSRQMHLSILTRSLILNPKSNWNVYANNIRKQVLSCSGGSEVNNYKQSTRLAIAVSHLERELEL